MIIYGINPVLEALQSEDSAPDRIWITRGNSNPRLQKIIEKARSQNIPVRFESARVVANKASTRAGPPGYWTAVCPMGPGSAH